MFCDKTKIIVKAGKGGDGCMSARREKYMPFGGPDGGDGGKGGDLIIRVNPHLNTLIDLHAKKKFFAEKGEFGKGSDMHGKDGEDLVLQVPKGTIVKNLDSGEVFDLKEDNAEALIAKGGRGGYGNAHFTSSIRQFPDFSELGEPTKEINLELELQLVADVGIIGLPSAGKSSLIARISNVKPKIADYHFTTLIPNIGVVKIFDNSLVVTDIPGLIEGASEGKGLGHEFLRHISRNSVLIHLIDGNSMDISKDYQVIQNELKKYSKDLFDKKQFVAVNKIDLLDDESVKILKDDFLSKNKEIENLYFVSAISGEGVNELIGDVYNYTKKLKGEKKKAEEISKDGDRITYTPHLNIDPKSFTVEEIVNKSQLSDEDLQVIGSDSFNFDYDENSYDRNSKKIFKIEGIRIVQIAKMTNFYQKGGIERLYDVLKKMKIYRKLDAMGAQDGDILIFGDHDKALKFREEL